MTQKRRPGNVAVPLLRVMPPPAAFRRLLLPAPWWAGSKNGVSCSPVGMGGGVLGCMAALSCPGGVESGSPERGEAREDAQR